MTVGANVGVKDGTKSFFVGVTLGRIGAALGRMGAELGSIGAALGRIGAALGSIGAALGRIGAALGRIGAELGSIGAALGIIGDMKYKLIAQLPPHIFGPIILHLRVQVHKGTVPILGGLVGRRGQAPYRDAS